METFSHAKLQLKLPANPLVGASRTRFLSPTIMGIKGLTKLLADHAPGGMVDRSMACYSGQVIAIDASISIHQVLLGRKGASILTNKAGEVTSHLQGILTRTIILLEAGIKPLYVFDGSPPELKKKTILKRMARQDAAIAKLEAELQDGTDTDLEKYSKRVIKVTKQHNEDCRRLLQLMGVPSLLAPSEAEAECAALCKSGKVYAVASEDMDTLAFGAPRLLRNLSTSSAHKLQVSEFDLSKVLNDLNLSLDQFIDVCILCGCDYCGTIKGIGQQRALKLIHQHGTLEEVLESINKDSYQVPDSWPFEDARQLFKDPSVTVSDNQHEPEWVGPDQEGLTSFLVDQNNFNLGRVMKAVERMNACREKAP